MPYRRGNFSYVADTSFNPYQSMQEMLVPFTAYKDAYEKTEAAYDELVDKADTFSYLAKVAEENPDSKAAQIYKGYADELHKQAKDFSQNGLSLVNRSALSNLKRRYQGEIGRLVTADAAMKEEQKLRRQLGAKDSSMLYATDNLSIDDFLDGKNPNLYNISGTELYTRGAAAGKAASSRAYQAGDAGSTLGGYYRQWMERKGYSKESMDAFRANAAAIPELQQAADAILAERGVLDNLKGANLERARQSVLNGIIDGAITQEEIKPVRDPGVMSESERRADARASQSLQLQKDRFNYEKATSGITINADGTVSYDPSKDAAYQRMKKLSEEGGLDGYTLNPTTGKYIKDTESAKEKKQAAAKENKKGEALMKLDKGALAHDDGFDVTFGDNRHHYNYIGAISKHGNKWHTGAIGENNPGHWGWGFMSTSNVENAWGNFSAEGSDSKDMRVLSADEVQRLCASDPEILAAIEERLKASNLDGSQDIQIIEVPNEKGGGGQKGYLIAVH